MLFKLMRSLTGILRVNAKAIPGAKWLWQRLNRTFHPHERALRRAQMQSPGLLLQPSPVTSADRYPWIFAFLQNELSKTPASRILSYGCATGEEVFTLAKYFPEAKLVGIDINPRNIKICDRKLAKRRLQNRIEFRCAGSPVAELAESYDAILCLAVLRHGALQDSAPESCWPWIDFAAVDRLVADLAHCLKPGGYLALWNSHFRFTDMSVASQFDAVLLNERGGWANTPIYGPDNRRLDVADYCAAVFQKLG